MDPKRQVVATTVATGLICIIALWLAFLNGKADITNDCKHIGAFVFDGNIYACQLAK
jgi:hypothetical protein